jgi:hypothetical protein
MEELPQLKVIAPISTRHTKENRNVILRNILVVPAEFRLLISPW